ncbi:hypothetical protein ACFORL_11615 [Legionella dresdenensis]|uniref:Secreted protein n=1 Tax=Legionella dresdenensis TaxID=450200 RepID=A0ABV8CHX9_9GAMM
MEQQKITKSKFIAACSALTFASLTSFSQPVSAAVASGQLVLINSLAMVVNGSAGGSASSIMVQVSDSTGVCSTTSSLNYGGVVVVPWNSANPHSATKCTDITSVAVTPLKNNSGYVQYDTTANPIPPVIATGPTVFLAPTTPIANTVLIVTGGSSPAMVNSTTSWGAAGGTPPVYLSSNGSISVTGIMGGVGMIGVKAETRMLKYGIRPILNSMAAN